MTFKKILFFIFIFSFFYINFAKTECLSDKKVIEIINNSPHTPIEGIVEILLLMMLIVVKINLSKC